MQKKEKKNLAYKLIGDLRPTVVTTAMAQTFYLYHYTFDDIENGTD
jgi:hypothetical protein